MNLFGKLSIRRKLMLMTLLTSSVALLLASAAFLTYELLTFRRAMTQELSVLGNVVSDNSTASLTFNDRGSAEELLASLKAQEHIMMAALYRKDGTVFAHYARAGNTTAVAPPPLKEQGFWFRNDVLELFRHVTLEGEHLGGLYIQSDLEEMNSRLRQYAVIVSVILLASLLGAMVLSTGLQRVISDPISHLAKTAKIVSEEKNYSIRATVRTQDELGFLVDEFNYMLDQIQARDLQLQKARSELEERVHERTYELQQEIAERKLQEEKILEQATLIDQTSDAILVTDFDDSIRLWNRGAMELYGWSEQEAIGMKSRSLLQNNPTQDDADARLWEKGQWRSELRQQRRDGSEILVESRGTLLRDSKGQPQGILIVSTDITERKKMETQFLRAQRMESIGTLAGGIAHDINNILSPILLSVSLLKERVTDEFIQKKLAMVEESAKRGADLVKQVLTFSRGIEGKRIVLDPRHLINEVEKIARETFPRSILIRKEIEQQPWAVSGDATQLHQVLLNLCVNARDAIQGSGTIVIGCANIVVNEKFAKMHIGASVGPHVHLSVSDTGSGIPPDVIDRIFEPFFTTKELGKGTGLGLSTVLAIVKSHGGFVTVYSESGKGTTIKAYFPAVLSMEGEQIKEEASGQKRGRGEWILVVDDEVSIREIAKDTLEFYGYQVLTASDGTEALPLFQKNRERIQLVLTDIMMPHMDGLATIRNLRKLDPSVKIIAASGLTDKTRNVEFEAMGVSSFLAKPYNAVELLDIVHRLLSE